MSTSIQSSHISSEPIIPTYVWVQLGSTRPIRVSTSNSLIIDELIKLIKYQELPNQLRTVDSNQINIYTSNDNNATPLPPDLILSTLFTQPNAVGTTAKNPLYIKIIDIDNDIASSSSSSKG
jgi:hypothetical protein